VDVVQFFWFLFRPLLEFRDLLRLVETRANLVVRIHSPPSPVLRGLPRGVPAKKTMILPLPFHDSPSYIFALDVMTLELSLLIISFL